MRRILLLALLALPAPALAQVQPGGFAGGITPPVFGNPSAVDGGGTFTPQLFGPQSCTVPAYAFTGATTSGYGVNSGTACVVIAGTQKFGVTATAASTAVDLLFSTDNANDIGASAATRPRTGYYGTSVIAPLFRSSSLKVLLQGTGTGPTQVATTQTTAPTCTSNCGTSPSIVGTDTAMIVTMGGTGVPASGWVVTFNGTWAAAPSCVVQMAKTGMAAGKQVLTAVTTTTTMTAVTNAVAPANSDVYAVHCVGVQ